MHCSRLTWLLFISIVFKPHSLHAQNILINEFMSDNESTLIDDDGDYSDWIEIFNPSAQTVNLNGLYLSDDASDLKKWKFPKVYLQPQQFLVVFASGKDKQNGTSIHTNFKISKEGEPLTLSDVQGILIDQIEAVELEKDMSYGRVPDGGIDLSTLYNSSPENTNNSTNIISFSHSAGLYTKGFDLDLSSHFDDKIYYTLDGSKPSPNAFLYSESIALSDKSNSPNVWCEIPTTPTDVWLTNPAWQSPDHLVRKANILRCATFRNGIKTSQTYTRTYLISDDVKERYDMPIISLITEGDNLFDEVEGIYVPGIHYDEENPEWSGNYFQKDRESERPIHIEYFDIHGRLGFGQDAGVRIHGGKTRHGAQKSLRLYARDEYGKSDFSYRLMPQKNVNRYQRFLLQTTTGAWGGDTVIKDILAHEIARDLDFEKMDYQPVIVFINGEYWGIHHIRDRMDEEYLAYTSGLDIDSLEIDRQGNIHYKALIEYIKTKAPIDEQEYQHVADQMDIDSYIEYQIAEMFLNNYDWPSNNTRHWRPKRVDGKWRWMFYDIDGGFREHTYDMIIHNTNDDESVSWPNSPKSTLLFRTLLDNEIFQEKFLNRYRELIENDFRSSKTKDILKNLVDEYKREMPYHIDRWNFPPSFDTWIDDISSELITFLENRPCAVVDHIESFFDIDEFDAECIDTSDTSGPLGEMNDLALAPNPNNGIFSLINQGTEDHLLSMKIYNSLGQLVASHEDIAIGPLDQYNFDHSGMAAGMYALRLHALNSTYVIPMIISTP